MRQVLVADDKASSRELIRAVDGFGALERLRADPRFALLPIVALTASAMQGDREKALAAGFTSYLSKPVTLKALRAELARLLP